MIFSSAQRLDLEKRLGPELDVSSAPSHVGGDGHVADNLAVHILMRLPSQQHDLSLALVIFGIQHLVLDAIFVRQHLGEHLALLDAGRADQYWPACIAELLDLLNDRNPFLALRAIDAVLAI